MNVWIAIIRWLTWRKSNGIYLPYFFRYQRNRAFIDWLESRIKANGNRIETLKWLRCESNKEWFNFLKSSKMMLKFIEFMRTSLQNYQSFTEIKSFLPKLDFLKNEMEMDI